MKKILIATIFSVLLVAGGTTFAFAEENQDVNQKSSTPLTAEQIAEVKGIHKTILEKKKMLIQKYVEYGKLSKEQGEKITKRFDHHYKMMEESGFQIPKMGRSPHHKQKLSEEE